MTRADGSYSVPKRKQLGEKPMTGIQYVTDEKGRRVAVQIDLTSKKLRDLWEDFEDVLVSQSRMKEKGIPLEKVKADLIKSGKLRG